MLHIDNWSPKPMQLLELSFIYSNNSSLFKKTPNLLFINLLGCVKSRDNATFDENAVCVGAENGVWESLLFSPKVVSIVLIMLPFFFP